MSIKSRLTLSFPKNLLSRLAKMESKCPRIDDGTEDTGSVTWMNVEME
jgi:hypothetical protein